MTTAQKFDRSLAVANTAVCVTLWELFLTLVRIVRKLDSILLTTLTDAAVFAATINLPMGKLPAPVKDRFFIQTKFPIIRVEPVITKAEGVCGMVTGLSKKEMNKQHKLLSELMMQFVCHIQVWEQIRFLLNYSLF